MSLKQFVTDYQEAVRNRTVLETAKMLAEANEALQALIQHQQLTAAEIQALFGVDVKDLDAGTLSAVLIYRHGKVSGIKIFGLTLIGEQSLCLYFRRHMAPDEVLVIAVDGVDDHDDRLVVHAKTTRAEVVAYIGDRLNAAGRLDLETGAILEPNQVEPDASEPMAL